MKFCMIYKIERSDFDASFTNVVSCKDLTDEQFDDLVEYFEDITAVSNFTELGNVATFKLINKNEILEGSPLPDGTIVRDREFENGGEYLIALGHAGMYATRTKVAVDLEI